MDNLSGTTLKGYELQERIGAGGFGAVYKARQTTISRDVAIKIILPGFASRPDFIRRFDSEAQLVARLEHPFIVPLFDYWRDPDGAYLVMRWLRGGSLKDALEQERFTFDATLRLMEQITAALSVSHRNNVIHRDLKPGNILLDEDSNAYLADFGIAKDIGHTNGDITEPDKLIGSPDYLAPEQARSEPVTPQTDIYSLGVVLYEMLVGEHPFPNLSGTQRLFKHLEEPLPLIESIQPDIAAAINEVIQKATEKNPAHRYADIVEMMVAVRQALANTSESSMVELLTLREQQVLQCLVDGLPNSQIAEKLFIAISTVKWYTRSIYKKLRVRSRVQAIVRARELNLIVPAVDAEGLTVVAGKTAISHLPEPENPYKGLRAFQAADEQEFFGREKLTQKLVNHLAEKGESARFLAVVGPSGSGKSSLVKAGLIPALLRGDVPGSEKWFVVDMMPDDRPLNKLNVALMRVAADQSASLYDFLQRDEKGLLDVADLILPDDGSELVIIIDQFEEVFTLLDSEEERIHFLNLLRTAVTAKRSRVRIVITLRADFYDRPLVYPEFGELVQNHMVTVMPLSAEELERAIRMPAEKQGVKFEEGLIPHIIEEVNYQAGALPLLQYALTELFEQRDKRTLIREAYQQIGGAVGALAKRAEELYKDMNEESQEITRQMFLRLVTLGEGVEDTRRRTPHSELAAITTNTDLLDDIIDVFVEYRLLSLDHDPATRTPTVEVAHEAILREWKRLRDWLNESRSEIRMQRQLAVKSEEWRNTSQDTAYLLRGSQLEMFESWMAETGLAITPEERDYLKASTAEHQREIEIEQRRIAEKAKLENRARQVLQGLVAVFLIAAIVAGGLAFFALNSRNAEAKARQDAETAEEEALTQASIGLASQSRLELSNGNQDRAVLLALEALEHYPYTGQAESALADAVEAYIPSLYGNWMAAAWSPDGKYIAIGAGDFYDNLMNDALWITEADTYDYPSSGVSVAFEASWGCKGCGLSLKAVGCTPHNMDWSPSGDRVVSIYTRGEYGVEECYDTAPPTVWDTQSGELLLQFTGHDEETYVLNVDWSPDGLSILTAGADGTARVWDAHTGAEKWTITGHTAEVDDVAWSPDGSRIATASLDGTARIWNVADKEELLVISGHMGGVTGVSWSPNGKTLATASEDGLARIWDVETGKLLLNLIGHDDALVDVGYSPDGNRIATASLDGTARIWEATFGKLLFTFPKQGNLVTGVVWSPDGQHFSIEGSRDGRNWDVSGQSLTLIGHTEIILEGSWSPDGSRIATTSWDNTARIWDAITGEELLVLEHPNLAYYFDWSPDGSRLVVPHVGGSSRIWDALSGELLIEVPLAPPENFLFESSWSPDGSRIFSTDLHSNAVIWDAITGEIKVTLNIDAAFALLEADVERCILFGSSWSPDSKHIATSCAGDFGGTGPLIWDTSTGELLMAFEDIGGTEDYAVRTDWSSDGTRLVSSHKTGIQRVWDIESGELLQTFNGHTTYSYAVSWSPDGKRVASGDQYGLVKVWNPATGEEVRSFQTPGSAVNIGWSPDKRYIIIVGEFNTPIIRRVWPSTQALIDDAYDCCVIRDLTPEEREQFGLPPRED